MRKRMLSILLTVCIIFTMLPTPAFATEGNSQVTISGDVVSTTFTTEPTNSEEPTEGEPTNTEVPAETPNGEEPTKDEPTNTEVPNEPENAEKPTESPVTETVVLPPKSTSTEMSTVSDALQAVYDMVSALPKVEDISDENRQDIQDQVTDIINAYDALTKDDQSAFDASDACAKLYAINDVLFQDVPTTYLVTSGDSGVYVGGVQLETNHYYLTENGTVVDGGTADNYNVYFDGSALTLNNANITGSGIESVGNCGIYAEGDLTISIVDNSIVTSDDETSVNSYGIYGKSQLTINGDGSLDATGGKGIGSYGIKGSTVSIKGCTVYATGNTGKTSCGINSGNRGTVSIEDGTVTATSSKAASSYGIKGGAISIEGSTVTATGSETTGEGLTMSYGINCPTVSIKGDTVYATGNTAQYSGGINSSNISIEGGKVTAVAAKATIISVGINSGGEISIKDGTVTATADTATKGSYGVFCIVNNKDNSSGFSINGGTITVKGGEATNGNSCGIYGKVSIGNNSEGISIKDSTVEATSGTATNESYGICGIVGAGNNSIGISIEGNSSVVTANSSEVNTGNSCGIYGNVDSDNNSEGISIKGGTGAATGATSAMNKAPTTASGVTTTGTWDSKVLTWATTPPHDHCVCGGNVTTGDHKSHTADIIYTPWDGTNEIKYTENVANICLSDNVTLTSTLTVDWDKTLNLCLNGFKLSADGGAFSIITNSGTLNLSDCNGSKHTYYGKWNNDKTAYEISDTRSEGADEIIGGVITGGQSMGNGGGIMSRGTTNLYSGTIAGNKEANWSGGGGISFINANAKLYDMKLISNISGASGGGLDITGNSTVTMYGGKISGNTAGSGGGINVSHTNPNKNASFTLIGGEISGNTADEVGGISAGQPYNKGSVTLNLNGGSITGNTARYNGCGVYVYSDQSTADGTDGKTILNLSGNVTIKGNKAGEDSSNLFLATGKTINITGALTNTTPIGITTATEPVTGTPVNITGNNNADYSSKFTSDNEAYEIVNTGKDASQVVQLQKKVPVNTANTRNETLDLTGDDDLTYYTSATKTATIKNDKILSTDITDSFEGWAWYHNGATIDGTAYTGKVLVLKGTTITVSSEDSYAYGIELPEEAVTIVVKDKNTIKVNSTDDYSYGVKSYGNITLKGTGAVTIEVAGSGEDSSVGLVSGEVNNIIVDGPTIEITAKSTNGSACGIGAGVEGEGTLTMESGNVTINASTTAQERVRGIWAYSGIILNGGTLNVTGKSADSEKGFGLYAIDGNIQINGGTAKLHGNTSAMRTEGGTIKFADTMEIKSGSLTGTDVTWGEKSSGGGSTGGGSSYDYYDIKIIKEGNGTISPDGGSDNTLSVREWRDQTLTFTPSKGYEVSDVLVDRKSVGAMESYTFENITKDHTLKVIFMESTNDYVKTQTDATFEDVQKNDWFSDSVHNAVDKGWFSGTSKTTFSPYLSTTRGMIATVLWRMEKEPTGTAASIFEDVTNGMYYTDGVNWAQANGIVGGYGNGKFGPEDNITREQMASILYRYAQFKGYDVSKTASLDVFTDSNTTSDYAKAPMAWAVASGLISGKGNRLLDPRGNATRAEVAAILTRFDVLFSEK